MASATRQGLEHREYPSSSQALLSQPPFILLNTIVDPKELLHMTGSKSFFLHGESLPPNETNGEESRAGKKRKRNPDNIPGAPGTGLE